MLPKSTFFLNSDSFLTPIYLYSCGLYTPGPRAFSSIRLVRFVLDKNILVGLLKGSKESSSSLSERLRSGVCLFGEVY